MSTGAVRCLINRCKIYTFIYWQEFILSREHAVQIADGRKAGCARATLHGHSGTVCVEAVEHGAVCSNVSISITTPQRQNTRTISAAPDFRRALRVCEILIINNGRVPSQGMVRREGVRHGAAHSGQMTEGKREGER